MLTVAERIKQFNTGRLPEFLSIKYKGMKESAFRFFRGTCHLFYEDMSTLPPLPPAPVSWVCGDLHIENFGSYKGDNRLEYFDLNDFDESLQVPVTWEVARLLTSILLAAESLPLKKKQAIQCCRDLLDCYTILLSRGKAIYMEEETATGIVKAFLKKVGSRQHKDLLKSRTEMKSGRLRFKIDKERLFKIKDKDTKKGLISHLQQWIDDKNDKRLHHTVTDAACRVAGTGSIGLERYAVLLQGKVQPDKYLALDIKEAVPSSIIPWQHYTQPGWTSEAHRITQVQYWMQNVSPALLLPYQYKNKWYVVRELQPMADKINFDTLKNGYEDFRDVIVSMGKLVASAQLRSTGRKGSCTADALADMAGQGGWQQTLLDYAEVYCRKVQTDYEQYKIAYNSCFFK